MWHNAIEQNVQSKYITMNDTIIHRSMTTQTIVPVFHISIILSSRMSLLEVKK